MDKLCYLNSRYYDPKTGRFINADSLDYLDPKTINGLNLYSYCNNNPVMNVDPSGHEPMSATAAILWFTGILVACLTAMYFIAKNTPPSTNEPSNVFDTDIDFDGEFGKLEPPEVLILTDKGFKLINWDFYLWRGYVYLDSAKQHGFYISLINASVFIGAYNDSELMIGAKADANVGTVGYDSRYLDMAASFVGVGIKAVWENGGPKLKGDPPGVWVGGEIGLGIGNFIKDLIDVFRR